MKLVSKHAFHIKKVELICLKVYYFELRERTKPLYNYLTMKGFGRKFFHVPVSTMLSHIFMSSHLFFLSFDPVLIPS